MPHFRNLANKLLAKAREKSKFVHRALSRFETFDSVNDLERNALGGLVFATKSFQDYREKKPRPIGRVIKAWLINLVAVFYLYSLSMASIYDTESVYLRFGHPIFLLPKPKIISQYLLMFVIFSFAIRITCLIEEKRGNVFVINMLDLHGQLSSICIELNEKNLRKLRIRLEIWTHYYSYFVSYFFPAYLLVGYSGMSVALVILNPLIEWKHVVLCLINGIVMSVLVYYLACSLTSIYTLLYISLTFIKYRFQQVAEKMKKAKSVFILFYLIKEHNLICDLNARNNVSMNKIVAIGYFCFSPLIDYTLYQALNASLIYRIVFAVAFPIITIFLGIFVNAQVSLTQAAHSPYQIIHSFLAKNKTTTVINKSNVSEPIPLAFKFKISHYLERFSGPPIASYVADFFAMNNFELYTFIAAISCNYILLLGAFND